MAHDDDYNYELRARRNVTAQGQQLSLNEARVSRRGGRTEINALLCGTAWGWAGGGQNETHAKRETESAVANRLAELDAADPSQKRPTPKAQPRVDWMDHA